MLKLIIILPRQARDKQTQGKEHSKPEMLRFRAGRGGYPGDQIGLGGGDVCDQRRDGTRHIITPRHVSSSHHARPAHIISSHHSLTSAERHQQS